MCDAKAATIYKVRAPDPDGKADTDAARTQKANCKKEGLMNRERKSKPGLTKPCPTCPSSW